VKKYIFALIGALGLAFVPLNANAVAQKTDANGNCYIQVNSGEYATINYNTNGCYVVNNGNLTIANGAKIVKKISGDNHGVIDNYGTLTISGGYLEAYYGYGIFHNAGKLTISDGTINAPLHQVIWAKAGTNTRITGGSFRSAIGGEEAIYTKGTLAICSGNFNASNRSNLGKVAETAGCPTSKPTQAKVASASSETITITIESSTKKTNTAKATTSKPVVKTTVNNAPKRSTVKPVTKPAAKQEVEKSIKADDEKNETSAKTNDEPKKASTKAETQTETKTETLPEAGKSNNAFAIAIAATITVLGSASAGILISRIRR
jgi:hypothetical protein